MSKAPKSDIARVVSLSRIGAVRSDGRPALVFDAPFQGPLLVELTERQRAKLARALKRMKP